MKLHAVSAITFAAASLYLVNLSWAGSVAVGSIPGSFDVTLSGSSTYSVPIKIAPGSAGTQPQLQLNYDSQTLAGPLGAGWSLSGLSVITRGPKDKFTDGVATGIKFDDQDALYLDGQRLVELHSPAICSTGSHCYRKANDDFTEIVRFGQDLDSSYFRVRTKGGVTLIFGNPGNKTGPRDPNKNDATILVRKQGETLDHVLAFAESAALDTVGNYISFHYEQYGNGDYNVREILYTGHGELDNDGVLTSDRDPFASVSFLYAKAPALRTYVSGAALVREKKLTDIFSCVADTTIAYPFDCQAHISKGDTGLHQVSHYQLETTDTGTASRFVVNAIHMFGANDSVELSPTRFKYTPKSPGWHEAPNYLPAALAFSDVERIARGYRFGRVNPATTEGLDLLFSAEINGKTVAFAFKNNGPASWSSGGQPWSEDGRSDVKTGAITGFAPPIPFVDQDGADLGVVLADVDGTGRSAILQSYSKGGTQGPISAYLPGVDRYEAHPEYNIPFVVSKDGAIVSSIRQARWSGGGAPDMIYESEGKRGFLQNLGSGVGLGWKELDPKAFAPPIDLGPRTHLVDLGCTGAAPSLVGTIQDSSGAMSWKVYRFDKTEGWKEEVDPIWIPPFPAVTDPEAIREVHFSGSPAGCKGFLVASAKQNLHLALIPSGSGTNGQGWVADNDKTPTFDLVDANGRASRALVANLKGDGNDGIVANTINADGSITSFAFMQDPAGWRDVTSTFVPSAAIASDDPNKSVFSYLGGISGRGRDDIAILNDQRVTASDDTGRNRQFGKFFTNNGNGFFAEASFAPPIQFATPDKTDTGVRFIDLHNTGLPDALVSRLVTKNGKTYLSSEAYRNTGHGWVADHSSQCVSDSFANIPSFDTGDPNPPMKSGFCPPVPFSGPDIAGNPTQFVDLDGDNFVDLVYSYRNKNGKLVTKIYFNKPDPMNPGSRAWVDSSSSTTYARFLPPADVYPLASSGIGDMGVRFGRFDLNRISVLVGFRSGEPAACDENGCTPTVGALSSKAFTFDGNTWVAAPSHAPPVPFVTQYDSHSGPSIDLFVQTLSIDGGLPALVANFNDPVTGQNLNKVWTNNGQKWTESQITVPDRLDLVYVEPKTIVQIADVNGDGLPDIVMTNGNAPANSKTWLGNGQGWDANPSLNWQVPAAAISNKDGEPGFRLVDTKGDGFLDVLWMRPDKNGNPDRGLALNNGNDWSTRNDSIVPKDVSFADSDGVDQGVRLLSVTGKGLSDIVTSYQGTQRAFLNVGRRSDMLAEITDGYGIATKIAYETLLESDCSGLKPGTECGASESGVQRNSLSWRAYERGLAEHYPQVSAVPTTYVVRQAVVDEKDGRAPVILDYRYGDYRVDADASRPLGFGWRESLNEYSKLLTRSEMVQDARVHPGAAKEMSCVVDTGKLDALVARALAGNTEESKFPSNLCPSGAVVESDWGTKVSETSTCWTIVEGNSQGQVNEFQLPATPECNDNSNSIHAIVAGSTTRQTAVWKTANSSYELDGRLISNETSVFRYDRVGTILDRHGNALLVTTELDDGSSIQTENKYADDVARWFLGRLTEANVTKKNLVETGPDRVTEVKCSRFGYEQATGLLSRSEVNCGTSQAVTTTIDHDRFGNGVSSIISAVGQEKRKTTSEYDAFGRFQTAIIDVLGYRSTALRDVTTGQILASTDINSLTTSFSYDEFGRQRSQTSPTGVTTRADLVTPDHFPKVDGSRDLSNGLESPVAYAVKSQIGALPAAWVLYDAKGRQIRQISEGFTKDANSHRYIFRDIEYDSLGRVTRTSVPHGFDEADVRWMSDEYDALGRVCASTALNGLRAETLYQGREGGGGIVTVVADPARQLQILENGKLYLSCGHVFEPSLYKAGAKNQQSVSVVDMRKELIESRDALGSVIFSYDSGGRITKTVGPTGATTENVYDQTGNKISVSDPDLGTWHYEYDPFGRVVRQTDAKGQVATAEYDLADRPKRRISQDLTTIWSYDAGQYGLGKISSAESSNGYREDYYYDRFGRLTRDAVQIDQDQLVTSTDFDAYGRAVRVYYPSGLAVNNGYDEKGFFVKVSNRATGDVYWTADAIDELGRVTAETYGNGVSTRREFNQADERIRNISATARDHSKIVDLTLTYDLIGNLEARDETVDRKKETFQYDVLNRLTVFGNSDGRKSEYRYDAAGRFTFKAGIGDYHYAPETGKIDGEYFNPFHAVIGTNYGKYKEIYKYDLNGNMVSAPEGHLDYTADNQVKLIYLHEAKWTRFDYGPAGSRFRQFSRIGSASQQIIYSGLYERVINYALSVNDNFLHPSKYSGFGRLTRSRNYLANSSGVFAVVETDDTYSNTELFKPHDDPKTRWYGKLSSTETWYMHTDQLGSVLRVTDQSGTIRERFWYDPWGKREVKENDQLGPGERQRIAGSWQRGYVGQEHLDAFNVIHMNGRVYNASLAVFTSVDPVNAMMADTQSGNGYAYARDNPLRYIDPTGFSIFGSIGKAFGDFVGGVGHALGDAWRGVSHFAGEVGKWFHENWRTIVVVAVVIVVTYVTLGTGSLVAASLADAILAGAAAGAAGAAAGTALYGGTLDQVIEAAVKGAVIGAFSGAASYGVGQAFGPVEKMSWGSKISSIVSQGGVGGLRSEVEGGGFRNGFIAAAFSQAAGAYGPDSKISAVNTAQAAIVGGTAAQLTGGKFVNGAVTGAFTHAFAENIQSRSTGRGLTLEEREIYGDSFTDETLSSVRVHDNESPWWLRGDAAAVTLGNDVYIRPDQYDPTTTVGAALLGHELVHVEQFNSGLTIGGYILSPSTYEAPAYGRQPEFEADLCRRYSAVGCENSSYPPRER
ncbi:eCIS core domain-containing protein [Agrobacterium vitis]|uniref:eCIS core domain-containing protein n=1 Tax=Agrobacterium vitis TaxID=373 RepID=UPI003D2C681B